MASLRRHPLVLLAGALAIAAVAVGAAAWASSPSPTRLDGRVRTRLERTGGAPVALDAVAPILRQAVVATEDERFYRHDGIDLLGVLRALPYDLVHLSLAQGASTITEQLGKVVYLDGNDHSPWRKLQDAALALKLESRYSKDEILAAYLNSAYFGEGAYGVRAASERYFGLPSARLGTAQASLLAGLIQAPSAYDPLRHPELARARQADVLRSLVRNGFLTPGEAATALARPLPLRAGPPLPPLRGVDLAPGPAFVWWELAAGAGLAAAGVAALLAARRAHLRPGARVLALRLLSLMLVLVGAGAVVRSFRTV